MKSNDEQTRAGSNLTSALVAAILIIGFCSTMGLNVFSQGRDGSLGRRSPRYDARSQRTTGPPTRMRTSRRGVSPSRAAQAWPRETDEANSSLLWQNGNGSEPTLEQSSWIYHRPRPQREVRVHDLVTVLVDEKSVVTSDGEVQRRKSALYDAILNDFVILKGFKAIKPSPQSQGDPRVQGQLTQLYRAEGEMETRQLLQLSISAEVIDIRPNGNLVLEARQRIRVNNEVWEVALSGICRRKDIDGNNSLRSEKIHNLQIFKRQRGHVRDSFRRGWFIRLLDLLHPF